MENKQQMIHMACEGILIGGLSLYFSKHLKQQAKEVEELKAIIAKNQASNEKRFEVIFNFLDNVNGGFMPQRPQERQVQLPEGPSPSKISKVNAAVVAQKTPQKKVTIEPKRLPQKKKIIIKPIEEPSVLTEITKKNSLKEEDVCDPNDEDCIDDIKDEMGELLEEDVIEESIESDMDE